MTCSSDPPSPVTLADELGNVSACVPCSRRSVVAQLTARIGADALIALDVRGAAP
jgi:hypothetical protein